MSSNLSSPTATSTAPSTQTVRHTTTPSHSIRPSATSISPTTYHRGSVLTTTPDWPTVIDIMRLPSIPLVVVLLVSEMSTPSAISMLLYDGSTAADIVLSLMVLVPLWSYIGLYVYSTAVSSRYIEIVPVPLIKNNQRKKVGEALRYAMEPTYDILLVGHVENNDQVDIQRGEGGANRWLRRNYYFVADRRWALFGSLEVIGGTVINMLEGIPLTTTSRTLCIARPVCVLLITAILLILLLWRVPCAVRMQQWCSILVLGGMLLTSILATANAVSPSDGVELAAGYVGAVVIGASMILGLIETILLVLTYVPVLREMLSLRPRGLEATLERSSKENDNGALHVPMLVVTGGAAATPPQTTPPTITPPTNLRPTIATATTISAPTTVSPHQHPQPTPAVPATILPIQHPTPQHTPQNAPTQSEEEEAIIMRKILEDLEEFERTEYDRKRK